MTALPPRSFLAWLRFWVVATIETLGARRFARVLAARLADRVIDIEGLEHVPRGGAFVFAVNHYHAGLTLDVVAATLRAAARARPRIDDECAIVTGHRVATPGAARPSRFVRALRWLAGRFFARWSANVVRIRIGASEGVFGLAGMRAWRARAEEGPTLVFPEGVARGDLTAMREGSGSWLASFGMPVVPTGVHWAGDRWRVAFGRPITWARRRDLRDVQLGLAIAALLPPELAPSWTELLDRFTSVHASASAPAA
ncbi:MAG: hypothetical protein JST00_07315 [Deltaproteobacteria bacterium]|nr:hypothetical protein [Deltaproteobacteria bacterium]